MREPRSSITRDPTSVRLPAGQTLNTGAHVSPSPHDDARTVPTAARQACRRDVRPARSLQTLERWLTSCRGTACTLERMTRSDVQGRPDAASGVRRAWHPYARTSGDETVLREISEALNVPSRLSGKPPTRTEWEGRAADLFVLFEEGERGALRDGDDEEPAQWFPVRRQPLLWELRLYWDAGTPVRAYFHEPDQEFDQTVVALMHAKEIIQGDEAETNRRQNEQMDEAARRISFGTVNRWGLGHTEPLRLNA